MRILLTNDDGHFAPGLLALARELGRTDEVVIVAPEREQSGVSSSLTLYQPLFAKRLAGAEFPTWAVSGTPADSVKLALTELLDAPPNLVISGINYGLNTGPNILYSGTLAAALEAAQAGHTAIAVSLERTQDPEWPVVARLAAPLIRKLAEAHPQSASVFSLNIPGIPVSKIRGTIVTRQDPIPWIDTFSRRVDPRGRTYFWLEGSAPTPHRHGDGEVATDAHAVEQGYISVTPIHRDLTAHDIVDALRRTLE